MSVNAQVSTSFLFGVAAGAALMWLHRRYKYGV